MVENDSASVASLFWKHCPHASKLNEKLPLKMLLRVWPAAWNRWISSGSTKKTFFCPSKTAGLKLWIKSRGLKDGDNSIFV